ncbi:MAG: 4-hydroxybenzoate 3-monooxygenase [Saprospiraceae bacterium]
MKKSSTQVGIIGAGPAGLFLSKQLHLMGIDNVILENRSREYCENRLRAGLLEQNTTDLLEEMGVAENLHKNGIPHHGVLLSFNGERVHVPFEELTSGRKITIYGQRFVVRDLIVNLVDVEDKPVHFEAKVTKIEGIESKQPIIHYEKDGAAFELHCDYVAACDGYHGIGRKTLPEHTYNTHRIEYPFSWLGILADTPPSSDELIYAFHKRGFALLSYRSETVSRLYIQVPNDEKVEDWPDEKLWNELDLRLASKDWKLNRGPITQKSITPMRSYMIDHMQHGRLFMAGDAAHIVPPTGGKGLNLAVADVRLLSKAFEAHYKNNDHSLLDNYSTNALRRVWRTQHFSNFMTQRFHKRFENDSFDYHLQKAQFDYIKNSKSMRTTIAENYVGLKEI